MYKKMYLTLFNAITDALEHIDVDSPAAIILIAAQQKTEKFTSLRRMTLTEGCTLGICFSYAAFSHCFTAGHSVGILSV